MIGSPSGLMKADLMSRPKDEIAVVNAASCVRWSVKPWQRTRVVSWSHGFSTEILGASTAEAFHPRVVCAATSYTARGTIQASSSGR